MTGNDGAAVDQVGTLSITPDGTYRCVMQSPDVFGSGAPDHVIREGRAPALFSTLEVLIRTNARDGFRDPSEDIAEYTGPGGTVAVLPGQQFNGLASPVGSQFIGAINAMTEPDCLPFG
ncbi:hypothetical protein KUL25_14170 [Rhodobacteraceae bacterium N5(2021)]|uniref:Uncharacterized protein n=1 Tax=Gymnodinialimonas phycosphaerae TaxID=2841589 RepID=A0A975TRZ1_9RHOB|nr:hypothetical protein [Gymnodinialimonas phycosphaerae]MBY4893901.1 hypothetical protein [Gymnodinialimonas phycosphaerae]